MQTFIIQIKYQTAQTFTTLKFINPTCIINYLTATLSSSNLSFYRPKHGMLKATMLREDCQARKLNKEDAMDRCKWRKMIKEAR